MYGLKNVRNRRSDALSRVAWDRLESLLAIYYRGRGYRVEHCGTGAGGSRFDGGIDLKLFKDDEYIVVQCKHWNAKQVPHNDVHQLLGIMLNEGATGAILVSSGEFTAYARESAAKQGRVQLIDGDGLRAMIGPLPEPEVTSSGGLAATAGSVAAHVGDRLLSAAEDRIRGRRPGRGYATKAAGVMIVLKIVLPLVFALFVALLFFGALKRTLGALQNPTIPTAPQPERLPAPSGPASQPVTAMPVPQRGSSGAPASRQSSNPCHEVIDWQSGTYIDHCAQQAPRKPPTAAEQRELQRKADEAIKVIEATTPEV